MRSLTMSDMNRQRLAEFLIIEDQAVITIPSFALMHLAEADQSAPIASAMPGRRWTMKGFLAWLVSVAASYTDGLCPEIESGPGSTMFHTALLNRHVTATALANVLEMTTDEARDALRDHLTFPDA